MSEWNPSDYDPEVEARDERRQQDLAAARMGVDRDTVNAWIRATWIDFETKLHRFCGRHFRDTGVNVSDSEKAAYRRKLHESLRREFGRSLPDKDWTDKVEADLLKRGGRERAA